MLKGHKWVTKTNKPVMEDPEELSQNKNNLWISFHMAVPSGPRRGSVLGPSGLSVQNALQATEKSRTVSFIFYMIKILMR